MFGLVDERLLLFGECTPQHEHQVALLRIEHANNLIGEQLPTALLVRVGLPCRDGQCAVEQQYALFRPLDQMTVRRAFELGFEVSLQLVQDVVQRRRDGDTYGHAEAEALGSPR